MLTNLRYHKIPGQNGMSFPAVTSLIELFAEYGLIDTYIPKSEKRAGIGTLVHKIINEILKGGSVNLDQWTNLDWKTQNAIIAFLRWQKDTGFKPRICEELIYSLKYGLAGHTDAIGTIKQSVGVFDWKLGDIKNERVKYQLSAYGFLYLEQFPNRTLNRGFRGVHLDTETATYKEMILSYEEGREYFERFLSFKREVGII